MIENPYRRQMILNTLFGAGALGLRSFATGIPLSILAQPHRALAAEGRANQGCANPQTAQYLILSTSSDGDPINANVPGTYGFNNILHPKDPSMAATDLMLGATKSTAAAPWASLPQATLNRTVFFHHATYTVVHGDARQSLRLDGEVASNEMLASMMSSQLSGCLGTVQAEPVCVGSRFNSGEILSYAGRSLPGIPPRSLASVLTMPKGPLRDLRPLRDSTLDALNSFYKTHGNAGQSNFIDRWANSQTELRSVSDDLLNNLAAVKDDSTSSQIISAITLFRLNVTPVVTIHINFGGDNHTDNDLAGETKAHVSGVASINSLMSQLQAAGLGDKVTFLSLNVFGRSMNIPTSTYGRNHNGNHHCAVMIGSGFQGGIVGGLAPVGSDFMATGIDSNSGASVVTGADIPFTDTFGAMGKTVARGCGLTQPFLDTNILRGKVVKSALSAAVG